MAIHDDLEVNGELRSILSGDERDFLVRNNGDQVKVTDLSNKVVGLYFSASWCRPCRGFTPKLVECYKELTSNGRDFEVVFVSADEDEESFGNYFSEMPWLAIPFSDSGTRDRLNDLFTVSGIPHLVVLDGSGKIITTEGVQAVADYGLEGYPFTPEKIEQLKAAAMKEQTLLSILVSSTRDFLISNNGDKVLVSDLEGKVVGLYFCLSSCGPCRDFTPILENIYMSLKERGENFEVVLVSLDDNLSDFKLAFAGMPWLAIPCNDRSSGKLVRYFELHSIPTLVIIGSDGKTRHTNVVDLVGEHGIEAYPFTPEKLEELAEKEKAKLEAQTLESLLVSEGRDYVIGKDGVKVKVTDLSNKVVGLYFSASWCRHCRGFTAKLVECYKELTSNGRDFEVVFVSADENEESFGNYFSEMPWLAIPFSDSGTRDRLNDLFTVSGIPHLVVLDGSGKIITTEGVQAVADYGLEGYPFTPEKIEQLKQEEEAAMKEQTLRSILVSSTRDFLISNNGDKVLVSDLEGKVVGLYFCLSSYGPCRDFTPILENIYMSLKERGENFEVVLVSLDDKLSDFKLAFAGMPWLAIPCNDRSSGKLVRYFELDSIPTLVIIGSDGKTRHTNVVDLVGEHGIEAYPFTPEKLEELAEKEKAKLEAQTLESLLVSEGRDYVIGKDGVKVPVSDLVGKNILLYFSVNCCLPCRAFLHLLVQTYHKIKEGDDAFEMIFISSDRDQESFDDYFATMPWLALPFGDTRKKFLSRMFKVRGTRSLVAIGRTGKTVTTEARELVMKYGANAYPFTREREAELEESAKGWPETLRHAKHEEHDLMLTRRGSYICDGCEERGNAFSFYCIECDFDLHPKCALEEQKKVGEEEMLARKDLSAMGRSAIKLRRLLSKLLSVKSV